jgi:hypothetical protein
MVYTGQFCTAIFANVLLHFLGCIKPLLLNPEPGMYVGQRVADHTNYIKKLAKSFKGIVRQESFFIYKLLCPRLENLS